MSKSILVIDTPKECNECPLCHSEESVCQATWEYNGCMADIKEICPLKPLPQNKDFEWDDSFGIHNFKKGFNACIEEILGDEDGTK